VTSGSEDALTRAEQLLQRLESTRAELEQLSQTDDADRALEILGELADLSRQVEEELQRAKREAEEEADAHS
jgi:exonuclease VII small subunit